MTEIKWELRIELNDGKCIRRVGIKDLNKEDANSILCLIQNGCKMGVIGHESEETK